MNFFEILEIDPPKLSLDPLSLEKKFYELSRKLHPDHRGADTEVLEKSAALNGAYRALKEPWVRANYILKLKGVKLGSKLPPCLAPLYFEMQEVDDKQALMTLKEQLLKAKELRAHQLTATFRAYDESPEKTAEILKYIEELVLENNYAASMLRDLESKL